MTAMDEHRRRCQPIAHRAAGTAAFQTVAHGLPLNFLEADQSIHTRPRGKLVEADPDYIGWVDNRIPFPASAGRHPLKVCYFVFYPLRHHRAGGFAKNGVRERLSSNS
jgi:hypothetical protein